MPARRPPEGYAYVSLTLPSQLVQRAKATAALQGATLSQLAERLLAAEVECPTSAEAGPNGRGRSTALNRATELHAVLVQSTEPMSTAELAERLGVTQVSIRRYLRDLSEAGLVRSFGGWHVPVREAEAGAEPAQPASTSSEQQPTHGPY